jgi:hypothetical protein
VRDGLAIAGEMLSRLPGIAARVETMLVDHEAMRHAPTRGVPAWLVRLALVVGVVAGLAIIWRMLG